MATAMIMAMAAITMYIARVFVLTFEAVDVVVGVTVGVGVAVAEVCYC